MELWIGRDFSKFAHTRYRKHGEQSGEEFREDRLAPALANAIRYGTTLTVVIDVSCSGAFLHEAFSKLPSHGFSREEVGQHLATTADQPHLECYSILAIRYLEEGYEDAHTQGVRA